LAGSSVELVACDNLVDRIWSDQPEPAKFPAKVHPLAFAGESHADKRTRLATTLRDAGQSAAVITLPDSICWLLNIRGADIPRNPIAQGFAVLNADASVDLFMQPAKLEGLENHLGNHVRVHQPSSFLTHIASISGAVRLDKTSAALICCERKVRATFAT
jgi:Xaa-Pro aminopeptidase